MTANDWKDDEELFGFIRKELYTAVIGDIMDKMGLQHQFLPPQIRPLKEEMMLVGRAMTVLEADCFEELSPGSQNPLMDKPFGLMLEALDDIKPGEVYICSGSSPAYALVGELMLTRIKMCGGTGAVVNGYSRDTKGIYDVDLPVFSYGPYSQDQAPRGKVIDFRVPIEMNGVRINPGDIIVGDIDGVCVVPQSVEKEVFARSLEKARGEKTVLKAIQEGMSAVEAWDKYGIM
ncbi:RraA family protein [Sunxiuqinia elliptica]|uniref:Putative 4-hydroxy-4-methyl-2-oxoglutarate aldolase n=1 Tax=Sunxiuqinia elliptica TaxID=655355 RepID=A0A1I2K3J9_9BACT|nr:RraA family protein [Sunxiuqinia elliptica]SFF59631.1 Regulator of RNase E activity RraA [Sunxiuqinia elliptica]